MAEKNREAEKVYKDYKACLDAIGSSSAPRLIKIKIFFQALKQILQESEAATSKDIGTKIEPPASPQQQDAEVEKQITEFGNMAQKVVESIKKAEEQDSKVIKVLKRDYALIDIRWNISQIIGKEDPSTIEWDSEALSDQDLNIIKNIKDALEKNKQANNQFALFDIIMHDQMNLARKNSLENSPVLEEEYKKLEKLVDKGIKPLIESLTVIMSNSPVIRNDRLEITNTQDQKQLFDLNKPGSLKEIQSAVAAILEDIRNSLAIRSSKLEEEKGAIEAIFQAHAKVKNLRGTNQVQKTPITENNLADAQKNLRIQTSEFEDNIASIEKDAIHKIDRDVESIDTILAYLNKSFAELESVLKNKETPQPVKSTLASSFKRIKGLLPTSAKGWGMLAIGATMFLQTLTTPLKAAQNIFSKKDKQAVVQTMASEDLHRDSTSQLASVSIHTDTAATLSNVNVHQDSTASQNKGATLAESNSIMTESKTSSLSDSLGNFVLFEKEYSIALDDTLLFRFSRDFDNKEGPSENVLKFQEQIKGMLEKEMDSTIAEAQGISIQELKDKLRETKDLRYSEDDLKPNVVKGTSVEIESVEIGVIGGSDIFGWNALKTKPGGKTLTGDTLNQILSAKRADEGKKWGVPPVKDVMRKYNYKNIDSNVVAKGSGTVLHDPAIGDVIAIVNSFGFSVDSGKIKAGNKDELVKFGKLGYILEAIAVNDTSSLATRINEFSKLYKMPINDLQKAVDSIYAHDKESVKNGQGTLLEQLKDKLSKSRRAVINIKVKMKVPIKVPWLWPIPMPWPIIPPPPPPPPILPEKKKKWDDNYQYKPLRGHVQYHKPNRPRGDYRNVSWMRGGKSKGGKVVAGGGRS